MSDVISTKDQHICHDEHLAYHSNEKPYAAFFTQTKYKRHIRDKHPRIHIKSVQWSNDKTLCTICGEEIAKNKSVFTEVEFEQSNTVNIAKKTLHSVSTLYGHER